MIRFLEGFGTGVVTGWVSFAVAVFGVLWYWARDPR